jgi:hypothetical protein
MRVHELLNDIFGPITSSNVAKLLPEIQNVLAELKVLRAYSPTVTPIENEQRRRTKEAHFLRPVKVGSCELSGFFANMQDGRTAYEHLAQSTFELSPFAIWYFGGLTYPSSAQLTFKTHVPSAHRRARSRLQ